MTQPYSILIMVGSLAVFSLAMWVMDREGRKVSMGIRLHRDRAANARSKGELRLVREEFLSWAHKTCWHSSHHDRARTVLAYIAGRMDGVPD